MKQKHKLIDIDGSVYTQHGMYNMATQKPYVEIMRNGEHYCYMPWGLRWSREEQ